MPLRHVDHVVSRVTQPSPPAAGPVPYRDQVDAGIVRRAAGPSYVPAQPEPRPITPTRVEVLPPAELPDAGQPLSRAQSNVTGGHLDRAEGFAHVTGRLALAMGGLGVLVAVVGMGAPVFSLVVLAWFGSLYAGTWLIAYMLHVFVSAEGAAWLHVRNGWRWLDREQAHRHELERHANGLDTKRGRK